MSENAHRVLLTLVVFVAISCGAPWFSSGPGGVTPPSGGGKDKYHCKNVTGKTNPWLVEWEATEKARMQAAAHQGVLLVHYTGCELEILYGCEQPGIYSIVPTTLSTNTEYITNEDEVFAKLPLGALKLIGEFQQGDRWSLDYAILGMQQTTINSIPRAQLKGYCARATHFVSAMAVGAYRLVSEAKRKAAVGVDVFGAAAGAATGGAAGALSQAGDYEKCVSGANVIDPNCQAIVQLVLETISTSNQQYSQSDSSNVEPQQAELTSNIDWIYSEPTTFYFTKTETTVAQYETCINAGACTKDHHSWNTQNSACNWGNEDRGNHPMNCVDWHGADTFCKWVGGRLPSPDEWKAEASNNKSQVWPWGNKPDPSCEIIVWGNGEQTLGCGRNSTWPVCSKPRGNSVRGLCDIIGNVREWTARVDDTGSSKSGGAYGGGWRDSTIQNIELGTCATPSTDGHWSDVGFRCVKGEREKGYLIMQKPIVLGGSGIMPSSEQITMRFKAVETSVVACGGKNGTKLTVLVIIASSGSVKQVEVMEPYLKTPIEKCVEKILKGVQFPKIEGGELRVKYSFTL